MDDVEKLLKTAMGEIERMLNTKTVVGEPITIEGNTLIPLVSVGFGFGAGGGGGVKPIALIIINQDGVRLEPIKGAATSVLEKVAETIGKTAQKSRDKSAD